VPSFIKQKMESSSHFSCLTNPALKVTTTFVTCIVLSHNCKKLPYLRTTVTNDETVTVTMKRIKEVVHNPRVDLGGGGG
jgi:hypothetical protein